jgi:RNA polymerase primary sigma factor
VDNEYEKEVEAEDNRSKVDSLLMSLDERSREVIKMLFGIGYDNPFDVEVVAERMGLTTTRIGQIKKAALKKLQQIAK